MQLSQQLFHLSEDELTEYNSQIIFLKLFLKTTFTRRYSGKPPRPSRLVHCSGLKWRLLVSDIGVPAGRKSTTATSPSDFGSTFRCLLSRSSGSFSTSLSACSWRSLGPVPGRSRLWLQFLELCTSHRWRFSFAPSSSLLPLKLEALPDSFKLQPAFQPYMPLSTSNCFVHVSAS